jgi:colanic acid/amylovoran biosynthesis glycosyltransferase
VTAASGRGRGRIAMVVPVFPQRSETFITAKFLGLLERGWDVHVVCDVVDDAGWARVPELASRPELRSRVHRRPPLGRDVRAAGAVARALPAGARARRLVARAARAAGGGPGGLLRAARELPLLELAPDVVHFEFLTLTVGRTWLGAALPCRVVASIRGYDISFVGLDTPGYYDPVWVELDSLHVLGDDLWRRALSRGCPPSLDHVRVPPALDPDAWADVRPAGVVPRAPGEPLRLLSVGRLEWKKGHEHALVAVRRLLDDGVAVRYRIVGGGAHLEATAFARHQLGLDDVVDLVGAVDHAAVRDHVAWADVFVHPSVSEGFGNAVVEAQAAGLPVVCSDADGLAENVADGETGVVVPRRDPVALARAIASLAGDPGRRAAMGDAGRARVSERFRRADQLDAFDAWYQRLLDR